MLRPLLLTVYPLLVAGCDPACKNEILQDLPSPDGRPRVVVFSRSCGATTGANTQATILEKEERLPDEEGNAFIIDKGVATVSWKRDGGLFVSFGPEARVFRKESSAGGVAVEYRP